MKTFVAPHRRRRLLLAGGLCCYGITSIMLLGKERITSSQTFERLGSALELLAEHIWSLPSALLALVLLAAVSLAYYRAGVQGKQVPGGRWLIHPGLPAFATGAVTLCIFILTLFPLTWAHRGFARSPDSLPSLTPFDALLTLLSVAGTVLCALYCIDTIPLPLAARVEKLTARVFSLPAPLFVGSLLMLFLALAGTIAFAVLNHMPHVPDSIAQLFQAKIFSTGRLTAPLPPHKEFFDYMFMINDTRWYSQYPPGHALLLLAGLRLGAPWMVGPCMGAASLFLFYLLAQEMYRDRRVSYLAAALLFFSPFFLFMSSSHMNHTSTLFFLLSFLYFFARAHSSPSPINGLCAGLSLGYAIMIRPLTATAVGAPFICEAIIAVLKKRERAAVKAVLFFTGLSLMAVLLLCYNGLTTGHPLRFGYEQKHGTLGFVGAAQEGPPHTLKGGVVNSSNNLIGLNQYLFEWPIPSLLFVFIFFLIPGTRDRRDMLLLCASLALMAAYFFYYYQDYCFGPRFYFCLTPFLILFTVRGLLQIPAWLEKKQFSRERSRAALCLFLCACVLWMILFAVPARVAHYSRDYWRVTDKIHAAVQEREISNAVVFIDCWESPDAAAPNLLYYGSGFQFNSPDVDDDVIYVLDLKDRNVELMKAFPGRNYYRCNFFWDPSPEAWR